MAVTERPIRCCVAIRLWKAGRKPWAGKNCAIDTGGSPVGIIGCILEAIDCAIADGLVTSDSSAIVMQMHCEALPVGRYNHCRSNGIL